MTQALYTARWLKNGGASGKRKNGHHGLGSARGDPALIRVVKQILH